MYLVKFTYEPSIARFQNGHVDQATPHSDKILYLIIILAFKTKVKHYLKYFFESYKTKKPLTFYSRG
jgi:hypothetical protein